MIGRLWRRVRKKPIVALYFEFENELKFYNLEANLLKNCYIFSVLALKAPITIAADDKFCGIIPKFRNKIGSADDSHNISCLTCYF